MNKFVLLFLLLIVTFSIPLSAQPYEKVAKNTAPKSCSDFHKKSCMHLPDEGFAYNAQSRSGFFVNEQLFSVKVIFFKEMDYHISVCTEDKSQTNFIIKDAKTGEVLYDNFKDNFTEEVQISNINTRTIKIDITRIGRKDLPAEDPKGICTGILIEHRRSDTAGF